MLVKERMSQPVITVRQDMPIMDTLDLLRREKIRRAPVIHGGKMVGIVSDKDLLNAAPSDATSLSIWELNHLVSKILVGEVMTRKVITVTEDTPIEEAAYLMSENKIGGLPVVRDGDVVGLITETDLFRIFLELMGARETGVRVTALVPEKIGELDELTHAIASAGGSFVAFGQFAGESQANRLVTFKVSGMTEDEVRASIGPTIERLIDIRTCC
jgi:acetoin utilization protein AcuB